MLADCQRALLDLIQRHDTSLKAYTDAQSLLTHLENGGEVPPNLALQLTLPNGSVVPMPTEMLTPALAKEYVYQSAAFLGNYIHDLWRQIAEIGQQGFGYCQNAANEAAKADPGTAHPSGQPQTPPPAAPPAEAAAPVQQSILPGLIGGNGQQTPILPRRTVPAAPMPGPGQ